MERDLYLGGKRQGIASNQLNGLSAVLLNIANVNGLTLFHDPLLNAPQIHFRLYKK